MKALDIINQIEKNKGSLEFLPTGLSKLDMALDGGFLKKELVILGGSTGIGKSYITGQIMFNIARLGFKTAYLSLEITNEMVLSRLIGQLSDIKSVKIMTGKMLDYEQKRKDVAIGKISAYNEYMEFYDDKYLYTDIAEIVKSGGYDFIIIDFIQNVKMIGMDEIQRLSHVTLELQRAAKDYNVCIMALSQLSNYVSREKSEPSLEYKGSGSIATAADLGFFVIRGDKELDPERLSLILKKNRRGVSGERFDFKFYGEGGFIQ